MDFLAAAAAPNHSGCVHINLFLAVKAKQPAYLATATDFAIFLSVLYWLRAYTDQIVAGIHPIKVICRIRQKIPEMGFPMVKNVRKGRIKERMRRTRLSYKWPFPWIRR